MLKVKVFWTLALPLLLAANSVSGHSYIDLGLGLSPKADIDVSGSASNASTSEADDNLDGFALKASSSSSLDAVDAGQMPSPAPEPVLIKDSVAVRQEQSGKLLGFLPVTFEAEAVAYADGHAEVKYPWYAFMVAGNRGSMEAKIEDALAPMLAHDLDESFDAEESEKIAARIIEILQANLAADTKASLSESADGGTDSL